MYNNQHQGIYTIRGDMCYENKLMSNVPLPERTMEVTCLTVPENEVSVETTENCKRGRRRFLTLRLVSTVVIILLSTVLLVLLEFGYIPKTKLGYYCKDPSISQPYNGDTVTWLTLLAGCLLIPPIIISIVEYDNENCFDKNCYSRVWHWYCDFFVGCVLNVLIFEAGKSIMGEHRPHFFATCSPTKQDSCQVGTYVTDYECTNTKYSRYFLIDSSRSFPSGHASLSFYAGIFCVIFISKRLNVKKTGIVPKVFLIFLCLLWSMLCSLTRITDHRHHWWDVLSGTVAGIITAYYIVRYLCKNFQVHTKTKPNGKSLTSSSTTALLDLKNKDATSVII